MRDLRHAVRSLARSPGFTAVAIVTLGLGLGVTTTMFGLLDAVRHPYVPFAEPDRLFTAGWRYNMRRPPVTDVQMYQTIRDGAGVFSDVVPMSTSYVVLEDGPTPGEVMATTVPSRFFAVLRLAGVRGRVLHGSDAGSDAIVVSHALWRTVFAGRDALGAVLSLDGRVYRVVGVMPRGMTLPMRTDVWFPMAEESDRAGAGLRSVWPLVRLRDGITKEAAEQKLELLAHRLTRMHAQRDAPFSVGMAQVHRYAEPVNATLSMLLGGAIGVLIIACANLANLMLARGLARRRELAVRMAVGASRGAVVREMFAEAVLIAMAGGVLGALISVWGAEIIASRVPMHADWIGIGLLEPQLSARVFMLATLAAGFSAVLFGLIPAIRVAGGVDIAEPLKDGAATTARTRRGYSVLAIAEVAFALALLAGAAMSLKILHATARFRSTFPAHELIRGTAWAASGDTSSAGFERHYRGLVALLRTQHGVRDVAAVTSVPPKGLAIAAELTGRAARVINTFGYEVVTASYLRTTGLSVIAGRDFEEGDVVGNGAAILDAAAAARLYPNENAVGRSIRLGAPLSDAPWVRVIGVVSSAVTRRQRPGDEPAGGAVYVVRTGAWGRNAGIVIRAEGEADRTLAARLMRTVRDANPGRAIVLRPWLWRHNVQVDAARFLSGVFVTMAVLALGLAAVGLYAVLSYSVAQRMREFALRMALGATHAQVRALVLRDGWVMVLAGTGFGAFVGMGASAAGLLMPANAWMLVVAEAVLIGVTIAACLSPARRAARANPMAIIRAV